MTAAQRIFLNLICMFLGAWFLMLGVGFIHNEWLTEMPTISYWDAVIIDVLIGGWLCLTTFMNTYGATQNAIVDLGKKR